MMIPHDRVLNMSNDLSSYLLPTNLPRKLNELWKERLIKQSWRLIVFLRLYGKLMNLMGDFILHLLDQREILSTRAIFLKILLRVPRKLLKLGIPMKTFKIWIGMDCMHYLI